MSEHWDDRGFREGFAQLRREDEQQAPAFSRSWEAARARGISGCPRFRLAAASVMLAAAAWWLLAPAPVRPAAQLSQWRSPTAFLLETPGLQLLRTTPRLGESFDSAILRDMKE